MKLVSYGPVENLSVKQFKYGSQGIFKSNTKRFIILSVYFVMSGYKTWVVFHHLRITSKTLPNEVQRTENHHFHKEIFFFYACKY